MPPINKRLEEFKSVIRDVSDANSADVIVYSGMIDHEGHGRLNELVQQLQQSQNVLLYLTTYGGDADFAYRIARLIQRAYGEGKFTLFVNTICKSAGALIAVGADEIVMSELSELGPLDVQLAKPDALAERTSGLTPKQALNTLRLRALETLRDTFLDLRLGSQLQITTRTALDVATQFTTGLFSKVYEQIDPMRLGEISRAMSIAEKYGTRIARGNLREDALRRLIEDYPSHGFVIDVTEAKELFEEVRTPTPNESLLASYLVPYVEKGMSGDSAVVEFISILVGENRGDCTDEHDSEKAVDSRAVQASGRGKSPENDEAVSGSEETESNRDDVYDAESHDEDGTQLLTEPRARMLNPAPR